MNVAVVIVYNTTENVNLVVTPVIDTIASMHIIITNAVFAMQVGPVVYFNLAAAQEE